MQRGGTNIAVNLIRSHPDCYWPDGELQEVLRGRSADGVVRRIGKLAWYVPIVLRHGDLLHPMRRQTDGTLSGLTGCWLKTAIERSVKKNRAAVRAYHDRLQETAAADRPDGTRMLLKVINGNTSLAPDLGRLYEGAVFVAIVRHPYAVCEGLMWRGAGLEQAIRTYRSFIETVFDLEREAFYVTVVRYEDLVRDPVCLAKHMYAQCGLDERRLDWVRLQDKTRDAAGNSVRVEKLYRLDKIGQHMKTDLNEKQAKTLSVDQRTRIASACKQTMERFDYGR